MPRVISTQKGGTLKRKDVVSSVFNGLIFLALSGAAMAQEEELPRIDTELSVIAREVRLHVLDAEGHHVSGLQAQDFVLREDGVPQRILFFEEVNLSPDQPQQVAASEAPSQREAPDIAEEEEINTTPVLVFLIDSAHMPEPFFDAVIASIRNTLDAQPPKGQLYKIIHLDEQLTHMTPFTPNPVQARAALDRIAYSGSLRRELTKLDRRIGRDVAEFVTEVNRWYKSPFLSSNVIRPSVSLSEILQRGYLNRAGTTVLKEAIRQSEHYEAQINAGIRRKEELKLNHFMTLEANLVSLAESMRYMPGNKSIFYFSGGSFVERGGMIRKTLPLTEEAARAINLSGTTLYAYHAKQPIDAARTATFSSDQEVDISVMNSWSRFPRLYDTAGDWRSTGGNTVVENAQQSSSGPNIFSRETGGMLFESGNLEDIQDACSTVLDAASHFYRLTYETHQRDTPSELNISLVEPRKGVTLHYGKSLNPEKPFADQDQRERWLACETALLYGRAAHDELLFDFSFAQIDGGSGETEIPVFLRLEVPPESNDGFLVGFAAIDDEFQWLDRTITAVPVKTGQSEALLYDVLLPKGDIDRLRCYVRDLHDGREGLISLPYRPSELPQESLFLEDQTAKKLIPINHLRDSGDPTHAPAPNQTTQARKDRDPFWFGDYLFVPKTNPEINQEEPVNICFIVRSSDFDYAQARFFVRGTAAPIPLQGRIVRERPLDQDRVALLATVQIPYLNPGAYDFLVELNKPDTEPYLLHQSFTAAETARPLTHEDVQTRLFSLAESGTKQQLDGLIQAGADLEERDSRGNTVLLAALQNDNAALAQALLERGVNIHVQNHQGTNALHLAAAWGNEDLVDELIDHGADPNTQDLSENTALFYAAEAGFTKTVSLLIARGAKVNQRNAALETPVFHAAIQNRPRTIRALADAGAELDIVDANQQSPMIRAVLTGSRKAVKTLLDAGANPDFHAAEGLTPLMIAAISQQLPICRDLLDAGAHIDAKEKNGNTALALTADEGFWHIVAQLAKWGADVNTRNALGETPLLMAVVEDHSGVVKTLVDAGAKIDGDNRGITPLMLAATNGYVKLTKLLLDLGADPNLRTPDGRSALDYTQNKDIIALIKHYQKN